MTNPERILKTLDQNLSVDFSLILYGRAALLLGYPRPREEWGGTLDVDAILPSVELAEIDANDDFWSAIEATNKELEPVGLYITHLFSDDQVILSPDWLDDLRNINYPLKNLKLRRPSTEDLILTKMMRVDPQDRADLRFLLQQADCDLDTLDRKQEQAVIPDIPEIEEAFSKNRIWLEQIFGES